MEERSVLEQHPELAQLWTLHFAGRVALRSLTYSRTVGPPLFMGPAVEELRRSIENLLVAVERYKEVVVMQKSVETIIRIPETWSPEQAEAVLNFISDISTKVWQAHQVKLKALAMQEAQDDAGESPS